jgi:hypothetical protein
MERARFIFLWMAVVLISSQKVHGNLPVIENEIRSENFSLFEENGKVGLKDEEGRVMIPAIYDAIGWSTGKLSIIDKVVGYQSNGLWGLIQTSNKVITPAEFVHIKPGEGSFLIAQKRSALSQRPSFGVINTSGKIVIPFEYDGLQLSNMRAVVMSRAGTKFVFGLTDLSHKMLIPLEYQGIYSIGSLRFAVQNFENKTAIFTEEGRRVTSFSIDGISSFKKDYAIVYQNQRQGLINRNGQFTLEPTYSGIELSDDGTVCIRETDSWFFLDGENHLAKEFQADRVKPLSPDHYAVIAGGKLQLTNNSLAPLHTGFFCFISDFRNGIALYRSGGKTGVVTDEGKILIPAQYQDLIRDRNFFRACLDTGRKNRWVLLNSEGKEIIEKHYEAIAPFNGKFYPVRNRGYWGAIDQRGKEIITCVHDSLMQHKDNHVVVKFKGQYGIISLDEHWIVIPQPNRLTLLDDEVYFEHAGKTTFLKSLDGDIIYFSDNALEYDGETIRENILSGAYLTIAKNGVIIKRSYQPVLAEVVYPESEGYQAIFKDGKFGFIDSAGRLRIANRYEAVQPFSGGRAAIRIMSKWGFIDQREKLIVQPVYDRVENFRGELSVVTRNEQSGLIDMYGRIVLPVRYDEIIHNEHHRFVIRQGNVYGLADASGSLIVHPKYDSIEDTGNGYVIVGRDGKFGVLTLGGVSTIPMIYDDVTFDPHHNQFLAVKKSPWRKYTPASGGAQP